MHQTIRVILLGSVLLSGCAEAIPVSFSALGLAGVDYRSSEQITDDKKLASKVREVQADMDDSRVFGVSVEVYEGRIMLVGGVPDEQLRAALVKATWAIEGVKEVLNEIRIMPSSAQTATALKAKKQAVSVRVSLSFDQDIYAVNYLVSVYNQVVYLLGVARSKAELEKVIVHIHDTEGIRHYVSHVRILTEEERAARFDKPSTQ